MFRSYLKQTLEFSFILLLILYISLVNVAITSSENFDEDKIIRVSYSGDILTHKYLYDRARVSRGYNFSFAFKNLEPILRNDLDLCHLETPLTNSTPSTYPVFKTPYQLIYAIKEIGYEGCSFASNHALDGGAKLVDFTSKEFRKLDLGLSGVKAEGEFDSYHLYEVEGVKIAHYSYTYGSNGIRPPKNRVDILNYIDRKEIERDLSIGRELADINILYLHSGKEYSEEPLVKDVKLIRYLIERDLVDGVFISHSHVMQRYEKYKGVPILYGMGNFWSGQGSWSGQKRGQIGGIFYYDFKREENDRYRFISGGTIPTFVSGRDLSINISSSTYKGSDRVINCFSLAEHKRLFSGLNTPKLCN